MEQHITPERIANSIMQDTRFKGINILVEGIKDLKVYTKLFNHQQTKLIQTTGKYKLRGAFEILSDRGFDRKIAIRDADFLRIKGNTKYDPGFKEHIFATDGHDSEMMMVMVDTLEDLLSVGVEQQKREEFEARIGLSVRQLTLNLSYLVACLKLANRRANLGLSFKPAKQGGNRIKFKKFLCEKKFTIDIDLMIHTIWEYSKNRDKEVSSKQMTRLAFDEAFQENQTFEEMINGHDIAEIVCIIGTSGLRSSSSIFGHPDQVEESLALSFDRAKFRRTDLFKHILQWQATTNAEYLFSE